MAVAHLLLLLCLAPAAEAAASDAAGKISPIQKVVQMMNDMMAKSKAEKQDETVRFAQYKMFCEMTEKEKKKAIEEGTEEVADLKATIQKAQADAAKLAKEIGVIGEDVAAWEAEVASETAAREKSHKDFVATHADYTESIDATERALKKMKAGPAAASLVQDSFLELSSKTHISEGMKASVAEFLRMDPMQALLQDKVEFQDGEGAPEAHGYDSSSGGVIDMVEKLGEKFEDELEEAEKREANMQQNYMMMKKDLDNQIEDGKEETSDKMATKASKEREAGTAEGDLAETSRTLAEDQQYLSDLVAECEQKSIDYEKRQEVRQGEIEALGKAIEIMTSDKVTGAPGAGALVQRASALSQLRSKSHAAAQGLVADFLADKAKTFDSKVLALLATKAADEPFKKVIKMIKDMIQKLMEEANEEAEHKGFCDTEMGTNKMTRDQKTEDAASLKATIEELTADIAKISQTLVDLSTAIGETDAAVAKATAEREEEKAKNSATIADAKVAQEATAQALTVLKDFYAKAANPVPTPDQPKGPIKYDPRAIAIISGGASLAQIPGAPEMEGGAYTGNESGGIVGMLEVIESDFARVVTETSASEGDAQRAFEQFTTDSAKDKAVKGADIKHFTGEKTAKESELASTNKDLRTTSEELAAAMKYYEELKPSCVDAAPSYEERVAARKAEIESLQEALKILSE